MWQASCLKAVISHRQEMLRKLKQGVTLVVDRYAFSGAVFTAAKRIPGLDLQWSKVSIPFWEPPPPSTPPHISFK